MYSYDERMAAVLYIKSDCSETVVFNTLGYPSPNAFRQWYREYEVTGILHRKVKRQDIYNPEQISAAVVYYADNGGSLIGTCRALGYPERNILSQWGRAAYPDGIKSSAKHCKSGHKLIRCSLEQKQAVVEVWLNGTPDYKIAVQYGVSKATVYA